MPISVDLTQLSGYDSLAAGTYTITAVAKGSGNTYTSSNKSQGSVYEKQPSGFNVTITERNNSQSDLNYKSYLKVYDGQDTTGTLLVNSTGHTAMPQTSVTCTTGYLYVEGYSTQGEGYTFTYIQNITGSITDLGTFDTYTGNKLSVASDGSFTISTSYDYD